MQRLSLRAGFQKWEYEMGWGGLSFSFHLASGVFFCWSIFRGGGKCPEEEHTTCSGGPTINCHKRGLWGEILFIKYKNIL
jgi:hypothetical protein